MERGVRLEALTSWLQRPLFEGSQIPVWVALAAGVSMILVLTLLMVLLKRRVGRSDKLNREPVTEQPGPLPVIDIANMQGVGSRNEQQDAFAISNIDSFDRDGLLMILCDGMGGMAEGRVIASETASELLSNFPWGNDSEVLTWVKQWSTQVYRKFRGQGGTTLVAAHVKDNSLQFWCVGDSDLFLLRNGSLYTLHLSQDYRNELVLRSLDGSLRVEEAFKDEQAKALSEFIGKENVECASTRISFKLQPEDALLLSSDGISDTLTLSQIREAMSLRAQKACDRLEEEILSARQPSQDNYTAILLNYHGKGVNIHG